MSEVNVPSRTEVVLGQAFGTEFDYYREVLRQPGNTVLLKLGGMTVAESMDLISNDVQTLVDLDVPVVLVHGASTQIDENLTRRGITPRRIDGIRETDAETLEVVRDTLFTVNSTITEALRAIGIPAEPFNEGTFDAEFRDRQTYGYVGNVVGVSADHVRTALNKHSVPVVNCLGMSEDGAQLMNVNADTASSALATELGVHKFVVLMNEGGLLDRNRNIIPVVTTQCGQSEVVDELIKEGTISGGAIPKIKELMATVELLPDSSSAVITHPNSVIRELFTHAGGGTLVRKGDTIVHHPSVSAFSKQQLRRLIEDSFRGKLNGDYFEQLPDNTEVFATAQLYDGAAIIIPGETKDAPAYLDKIVVPPAARGAGVGRELIDAAISSYPGGLFWRTRVGNEDQVKWYSRIADSQTTENDWVVFTASVAPENRNDCVQAAAARPPTVNY